MTVKKKTFIYTLFSLSLLFIYPMSHAQLAESIPMTSDKQLLGLGTEHHITSTILDEDRPFIVSLPKGYEQDQATYPVLYLLDGKQNIKHTVGTIEHLTESGRIPPMIIVAIESLDRSRDLTPSKAGQAAYGGGGNAGIPQSGGAPRFLSFLQSELIPHIEKNYRTHPYRILVGHSFGGLFSTYALMEAPELFDAFIIEAPALWWNKEELTERAKTFYPAHPALNKAVYFGIGGGDGWGMRQELKRYVAVVEQNTPKGFRYKHEEVGDEDHDEARLILNYNGLKHVFANLQADKTYVTNYTKERFLEGEQQLKETYGPKARRPAKAYYALFFDLLEKEKNADAIVVLERTIEAYSNYIGLYDQLAKLYIKTEQPEKAIATYEAAIELSKKYKLGHEESYQMEIEKLM